MPELSSWRHIFNDAGFDFEAEESRSCRSLGCENGMCAICFPACHYGLLSSKFDYGDQFFAKEPECAAVTYTCLSPLGIFTSWLPWVWPLNYNSRKAMKSNVHSKENDCETFFIAAFCSPCSNAQVCREMHRFHANDSGTQLGAPKRQRMKMQVGAPSCKSNYCS
jgi:hypothetical protein